MDEGNANRVLTAVIRHNRNLKVLHNDYLHKGSVRNLCQALQSLACLVELSILFYSRDVQLESFELFCQELGPCPTLQKLDRRKCSLCLPNEEKATRILRACAVALSKLPHLHSLICPAGRTFLKKALVEFIEAVSRHFALIEFPKCIGLGSDEAQVDYCLLRNRYRERLGSKTSVMVETFAEMHARYGENDLLVLTLVPQTLVVSDDWFARPNDQFSLFFHQVV